MGRDIKRRPGGLRRRVLALVAVVALFGVACGDDGDGSAADDGSTATNESTGSDAATIMITDQGIEAPEMLAGDGGEITVVNETDAAADAQFVNLDGTDLAQFSEDMIVVLEGGPYPDYFESAGGVGVVTPEEPVTAALSLPAGRYAVFSTEGGAEPTPDTIAEVEVTEDGPGLPETDGSVSASDYAFDTDLAAGPQSVTFVNEGPDQWHHMVLQEFPEGTTEAEARSAIETAFALPEGEAPPEGTPVPEDVTASAVFGPGNSGTLELDLDADRQYFIGCFIGDTTGGPPHAIANDMWDVFTPGA